MSPHSSAKTRPPGRAVPDVEGRSAFTLAEIATRLGISQKAAWRLVNGGKLRARKAGRVWVVPVAALQEFLDAREVTSS